jgi:hypothetical protein
LDVAEFYYLTIDILGWTSSATISRPWLTAVSTSPATQEGPGQQMHPKTSVGLDPEPVGFGPGKLIRIQLLIIQKCRQKMFLKSGRQWV